MSWVRARAYRDALFLLDRLHDQLEVDVAELNRLPAGTRDGLTFEVVRQIHSIVKIMIRTEDAHASDRAEEAVRLFPQDHLVMGSGMTAGQHHAFPIIGWWDMKSDSEKWSLADKDRPGKPIERITQDILEPYLFGRERLRNRPATP